MTNLLQQCFFENVARFPSAPAIEAEGKIVTYFGLNEIVQDVIGSLQKHGVQNHAAIVFNDQTLFSYAAILAVNFSGNTLLPLESSWPAQRISDVVNLAKPACVISSGKNASGCRLLEHVPDLNHLIWIQEGLVSNPAIERKQDSVEYHDVSYILFTSGSTGVPKGVPVKTENLNAFLNYFKTQYDFNSADRFLQVYDITFDVAYFSFFVPLCVGACACILDQKVGVPKYLCIINDLLKRNITVVSMVPTVLNFTKKFSRTHAAVSVRYSFFSGDVLYHSEALGWQEFVPNAAIHNYYGLTETTIVCTKYIWNKAVSGAETANDNVPIGRPFPGMSFKILNAQDEEVTPGDIGELSFAGPQVVDGYLKNVHSQKFFYAANGNNETVRFYKTGDLASVNTDGNLVFHGRTDHQVKVNGYRIELEEIQLAIRKLTNRKNVVVKKNIENAISFLCAYIEGESMDVQQCKTKLETVLPHYMIPAEFVFLAQLPLTENGKINITYLQQL